MSQMLKQADSISVLHGGISAEIKTEGYGSDLEGLGGWLRRHNVIPEDAKLASYRDIKTWRRGGEETYIASAEAEYYRGSERAHRAFVAKAIVTPFPELHLESWKRRREHLNSIGIPVSNWFDAYSGTILEPFYQYDSDSFARLGMLPRLKEIARILDDNGYVVLKFIDDIMSDGKSLFYVDFGFDLGDPKHTKSDTASRLLEKLENSARGVKPVEQQSLLRYP